jgi:hypothetical protein
VRQQINANYWEGSSTHSHLFLERTPAHRRNTMIHSVTGGIFRSVDMMIPRLLELKQRNEKKLADGSVKMQDLVKTAASRLMI